MDYRKINSILMRTIAVLLMLVMLSTAAVTGRFARYITTSSGSDSARVAKFSVTHDIQPVAGENGKFTLTVANNSEVAVKYSVSVIFDEALLPDSMKGKLAETTAELSDIDNKTLAFGEMGQLAPNETASHTLQLTVLDWKVITQDIEGSTAEKTLAFKAAVAAVQID